MKKSINIEYTWYLVEGGKKFDVLEHHEDLLEEYAIWRTLNMIKQGYTSGELIYDIKGNDYTGYWELK